MPDFKSAAVLVWMPAGDTPTIKSFQPAADADMPETAGYWELGAALVQAHARHPTGKAPWIKVDQTLLSPDECLQAYERFKNRKAFKP